MISVILAGGSGVRFWPISREHHPKQLLKIFGDRTLIQETAERLLPLTPIDQIYIITNEQHAFKTCRQLERYGFPSDHLLSEPYGRNTAPAIAWIAEILKDHPDEIMGVFPADHVVKDPELFQHAIRQAETLARKDYLVTLGVNPTRPETGYGYIESGPALDEAGHKVEKFIEKPDRTTAEQLVAAGNYFWNCGIFLWKVATIREEIQRWLPEMAQTVSRLTPHLTRAPGKLNYLTLDAEGRKLFKSLQDISIDYGVMEKSQRVAVVPTTMQWNDVGSWTALDDLSPKDDRGNVLSPQVYQVDCADTIVQGDRRVIGTVGLKDVIIVDTEDALLVCQKDRAQDIKKLIERLRADKRPETKIHRTVQKPWGSYTVLDEGKGFLLKRLEVLPGEKLSLQSHQHRSEHWVVASGRAEVQRDNETFLLDANQSITIPKGAKHRLGNPGDTLLVLIETQLGDILDESDIVRYTDLYGRTV